MRKHRVLGVILVLCFTTMIAPVGCGSKPPSASPAVDASTGAPGTSATPNTQAKSEAPPAKKAHLQDLALTLPSGWKAEYDGVYRWKVAKNVPPDYPLVLIRSLPPEMEPKGLIHLSHTLQTSTALTEGVLILDRSDEQSEFADGYYVVGKFFPRTDKKTRNVGFAMVRSLGGHKLIFACYKINDPAQRREALDFCKAAKF